MSLNYILWGYVKDQVSADNPQSIEASKVNIWRVIGKIEA